MYKHIESEGHIYAIRKPKHQPYERNIEKKIVIKEIRQALTEIETNDKILEQIVDECKVCKNDKAVFNYIGPQMFKGQKVFDLYNCNLCEATISRNITEYGTKLKQVWDPKQT